MHRGSKIYQRLKMKRQRYQLEELQYVGRRSEDLKILRDVVHTISRLLLQAGQRHGVTYGALLSKFGSSSIDITGCQQSSFTASAC